MSQIKNGDLCRVRAKRGTRLAASKKTPGAYRGTQIAEINNQIDGQAEFIPVTEDYLYNNYYKHYKHSDFIYEMKCLGGQFLYDCTTRILFGIILPKFELWCRRTAIPNIKAVYNGLKSKQTKAEQLIEACKNEETPILLNSGNIIVFPTKMTG